MWTDKRRDLYRLAHLKFKMNVLIQLSYHSFGESASILQLHCVCVCVCVTETDTHWDWKADMWEETKHACPSQEGGGGGVGRIKKKRTRYGLIIKACVCVCLRAKTSNYCTWQYFLLTRSFDTGPLRTKQYEQTQKWQPMTATHWPTLWRT